MKKLLIDNPSFKPEYNVPIKISFENIDILNNLKRHQLIVFNCAKCNKLTYQRHNPTILEKEKRLCCATCTINAKLRAKSPGEKKVIQMKAKRTKICRYGDENYNNRNKSAKTCLDKYGTTSPLANPKIYFKTQQTRKEKYGNENYVETYKFKVKKTNSQIEKYGDPNYTNRIQAEETFKKNHNNMTFAEYAKIDECKNKTKQTNLSNTGFEYPMMNPETREKSKETKLKEYGDPNYTNPEQISETKLVRYGDKYYNNSKKAAKTFEKHYGKGIDNVGKLNRLSDIQNKTKQTNLSNTGFEYPMMNPETREKSKETKLKEYGDPNYTNPKKAIQTKIDNYGRSGGFNHKYKYFDICLDSKWELAVWIYCIDHNIPIIRSPFTYTYLDNKNKFHIYIPDFWIYGIGLVEIKGDQFINKNTDKWICPFDRTQDDLFEAKHQCALLNKILIWKESECEKYLNYCKRKYNNYYWFSVFRVDNPYNPSYFGINGYYQLQKPYNNIPIYYASPISKGISPYDIDNNSEYSIIK